jgi:hypothetical protein
VRFYFSPAHYLWEKATGTDEARDAVDALNESNKRREVDISAGRAAISSLSPLSADIKAVASDVSALAGLSPAMPPPYAYPSGRFTAVASALTDQQGDIDALEAEMRRTVARWQAVFNDAGTVEGPPGFWSSMWDARGDIWDEWGDVGGALISPVKSTIEFVRNPIKTTKETLSGIVYIVSNPVDSAKALWEHSKNPLHWPEMIAGAAGSIASRNPSAQIKKVTKAAKKARKAQDDLDRLRAEQARAKARGEKQHKINQREKDIAAKAKKAERLAQRAGPMGWAYAGKVLNDFVEQLKGRLAPLRARFDELNGPGRGEQSRPLPVAGAVDDVRDRLRTVSGPGRGERSVPLPVSDWQAKRLLKELEGLAGISRVKGVRQTFKNLSDASVRNQELLLRHVLQHLGHGFASSLKLKPSVNGWGQFGHGVQEDQEAPSGRRRPR